MLEWAVSVPGGNYIWYLFILVYMNYCPINNWFFQSGKHYQGIKQMLRGCIHSPGSWLPLPGCHSKLPAYLSLLTVAKLPGVRFSMMPLKSRLKPVKLKKGWDSYYEEYKGIFTRGVSPCQSVGRTWWLWLPYRRNKA